MKYQWSRRMDARHTVTLYGCTTLDGALMRTDSWRRELRRGTPWRITDSRGTVLARGNGTDWFWTVTEAGTQTRHDLRSV
jgi:hypothetical protein